MNKEQVEAKRRKVRLGLSGLTLSNISFDGKTQHPHFLSPIDIENIISLLNPLVMLVNKEGGISDNLAQTASSPECYYAEGVGLSWERNAYMFRAFKEAGYQPTVPLMEVSDDYEL